MQEVLGIAIYFDDGVRCYGCRGTGHVYKEFYQWLRNKQLVNVQLDFPWDYWSFTNEEDHQELMARWGTYTYEVNDELK